MQNKKYKKTSLKYVNKIFAVFLAIFMISTAISTIIVPARDSPINGLFPESDAGGPYFGYTGLTITLNGSGSYHPGAPTESIVLYEWDFDGDGTYDWSSSTESNANHIYSTAGDYNAKLRVKDQDGDIDIDETNVQIITDNPELSESCGIDMVLIIDSSGSIDESELENMTDAFNDFVDAFLPNTPTNIGVVEFDTTAHSVLDYSADIPTIKNTINNSESGGYTNWHDALVKSHDLFDNRVEKPDLFVFASDGDPNTWGPSGSASGGEPMAISKAIEEANSIKEDGIRIITLGIGDSLIPENLIAISSEDAYYNSSFDTLADTLGQLASELCGGTITVRKFVDGEPAQGWEFSAIVTDGTATPTSGFTGPDGFITFDIEINDGIDFAQVDIVETHKDGYSFHSAVATDCSWVEVGSPGYERINCIPVEQVCGIYAEFHNNESGDETPPVQEFIVGDPNTSRLWRGNDYDVVGPCTPLTIISTDNESGSNRIEYSVWIAQDLNASSIVWQHLPQYDETVYDYDEDGTVNVTFYLDETCLHEIRYQCWDNEGNTEGLFSKDLFVDKCAPVTTKTVGCPSYGEGVIQPYWISDKTPIVFTAVDKCCLPNGTGVEELHIKVWYKENTCTIEGALQLLEHIVVEDQDDNDNDTIIGQISFPYEFHFSMSGYYELEFWSEDGMCNVEEHWKQQHRVDAEPPEITKTHPDHGYMRINDTHGYMKAGAEITLSAEDAPTDTCNVGLAGLYYRYEWNDTMYPAPDEEGAIYGLDLEGICCPLDENITDYWWYPYDDSVIFDEECQHDLYYFAIDNLCNYEHHHQTYYVDDTEPYMEVEYPGHGYYQDDVDHLKVDTDITLNAYDNPDNMCQTGIESIFWRYDWNDQFFPSDDGTGIVHGTDLVNQYGEDYDIPAITDYYWYRIDDATIDVSFPEECIHNLTFFAKDNVCHRSVLYNLTFYVDGQEPDIELEFPEEHGYYYEEIPDVGYEHHIKCGLDFTINAIDKPFNACAAGIETIFWRYEWNDTMYPIGPGEGIIWGEDLVTKYGAMYDFDMITDYYWYYSNTSSVDIAFNEECMHELYYFAKDNVCQRTQVGYQEIYVDCTSPQTDIYFPSEHGYYQEYVCDEYLDHVKCGFQFELYATDLPDNDCNTGIESIFYRYEWNDTEYPEEANPGCSILNGSDLVTMYGEDYDISEITDYVWIRVNDSSAFIHFSEECVHRLYWFAKDNLCHRSNVQNHTIFVDCSEPNVWLDVSGHGYHPINDTAGYLKEGKEFTIKSEDNPDTICGVGIESIFYRYDWNEQSYPSDDGTGIVHGTELVTIYGDDYDISDITDYWWYRIDANNYSKAFDQECKHKLYYFAKDNVCQRTDIKEHTFYVDGSIPFVNDYPDQSHGYYNNEIKYIKCGHRINISSYDLPDNDCAAGIESVFYRYEWNDSSYPISMDENIIHGTTLVDLYGESYNISSIIDYYWYKIDSDFVEISFDTECMHTLYYFAKDNLCHRTNIFEKSYYVDCTGPYVNVTHVDHGYTAINDTAGYLKGGEYINLDATDIPDNMCASGVEAMFWRWTWNDTFYPDDYDQFVYHGSDLVDLYGSAYDIPEIVNYYWFALYDDSVTITFNENCRHDLYFFAKDNVCNHGDIYHRTYFVDNEIPQLNVTYPKHGYFLEMVDPPSTYKQHLKAGIPITYTATDYPKNDCGAGIESIFWRYEYDGAPYPDSSPGQNVISGSDIAAKYGDDYNIPEITNHNWYQINDSSVDIVFDRECRHDLHIFAKDNLCHRTEIIDQTYYVDDSNPDVFLTNPGHGYYPIGCTEGYLKCYTPVNLTAYDYPDNECLAGIEGIFWRYEFNGSYYPDEPDDNVVSGTELVNSYGYTDPEIIDYYWYVEYDDEVTIEFEEECLHNLYFWSKDNLCHHSVIKNFTYHVDNTPPELYLDVSGHGYYELEEGIGHLKAGKSFYINATDDGDCQAGIETIFWRYAWNDGLYPTEDGTGIIHGTELVDLYGEEYDKTEITQYYWYYVNDVSVEINFTEECLHDVYYFAKDNVCHPTDIYSHQFRVDDSNPESYLDFDSEEHGYALDMDDDKFYIKCGKEVKIETYDLPRNDCAAGIESIFYRYTWNDSFYPQNAGTGVVSGYELVDLYGSDYDLPEITDHFWYRIDDPSEIISFSDDCTHKLFWFVKDNVCHRSEILNETFYVDCTAPDLDFEYPDHGYVEINENSGHLKAGIYINITAEDMPDNECKSGIESIFWRYEYDEGLYPDDYDENIYHGTDLVDMYGETYNISEITDFYWYAYNDDFLQIKFNENCTHDLYIFTKDNVCNHGLIHHKTYYVDDEAPRITVEYPDHGYFREHVPANPTHNDMMYVDHLKCNTEITLTATDYPDNQCAAGIESIFWRYEWNDTIYPAEDSEDIWTGQELVDMYGEDYINSDIYEFLWYRVDASSVDIMFGEECIHDLYYFAKDNVCHPTEVYHNRYFVDCSNPYVDITYPSHGYFVDDEIAHLKCYTDITLSAYDLPDNECIAGIEGIFWRYEWEGQNYPIEEGEGVRTGAELADAYEYTDPNIIDYNWYFTTEDMIDIWFEEECIHEFYYFAKDNVCHPSNIYHETFYVDNSEPEVTLDVGEPNCVHEDCECCMEPDEYCITMDTNITITAEDMPDNQCAAGIESIFYRVRYFNGEQTWYYPEDQNEPGDVVTGGQLASWYGYTNPDIVEFLWYRTNDSQIVLNFSEECEHELFYFAKDNVCHPTEVFNKTFYVDETPPPKPIKTVGDPHVFLGKDDYGHDQWMVYPGTEICFEATVDNGCCPCEDVTIEYRYWYLGQWTDWMEYTECITFTRGCVHYLEARAIDCLGNYGEIDNETFWVCAPGGGDSDPTVYFETPEESGQTFCDETLHVTLNVEDQETAKEDLTVVLYIPGGRRNAPTLYYYPEYNPGKYGDELFHAYIDLYKYQDGASITLRAIATDEDMNSADTGPMEVEICSTIIYDKWMQHGWNSLTLPLDGISCNESIESVLASIDGSYNLVYYFDEVDERWYSYWVGEPHNDLEYLDTGKQYWIHISGDGLRYYTDTNGPIVDIDYPSDEQVFYNEMLTSDIYGSARDIETEISDIYLTVLDNDTGEYWNGTAWNNYKELPGNYDDTTNEWYCDNTQELDLTYKSGHKIIATITATDMAGCSSTDSNWFKFIDDQNPNVEITYPLDSETYPCSYPNKINGTASDSETEITDLFVSIRKNTQTLSDEWWDGANWLTTETYIEADYYPMQNNWVFTDIPEWENGFSYTVFVKAIDAAENNATTHIWFEYQCQDLLPDLEFYKEIDMPSTGDIIEQEVGEKVRFHILVHNIGETSLTDIIVNDNLPDDLKYDQVIGTTISCTGLNEEDVVETVSPDNRTITWDFGEFELPSLTTIHIYFWTLVNDVEVMVNNANVTAYYTSTDSLYAEDNATVIGIEEEQECNPNMTLTKLVGPEGTGEWDSYYEASYLYEYIDYNITIENDVECCTLENISVHDILDSGLMFYEAYGINVYHDEILLDQGIDYIFEWQGQNLWFNFTEEFSGLEHMSKINIYFTVMIEDFGTYDNYAEANGECIGQSVTDSSTATVFLEEMPA